MAKPFIFSTTTFSGKIVTGGWQEERVLQAPRKSLNPQWEQAVMAALIKKTKHEPVVPAMKLLVEEHLKRPIRQVVAFQEVEVHHGFCNTCAFTRWEGTFAELLRALEKVSQEAEEKALAPSPS